MNKNSFKEMLTILLKTLVVFILSYLLLGFIEMQWNPFLMTEALRGMIATVTLTGAILITVVYYINKEINDQQRL